MLIENLIIYLAAAFTIRGLWLVTATITPYSIVIISQWRRSIKHERVHKMFTQVSYSKNNLDTYIIYMYAPITTYKVFTRGGIRCK